MIVLLNVYSIFINGSKERIHRLTDNMEHFCKEAGKR